MKSVFNWFSSYFLSANIPADSLFVRIGLTVSASVFLVGIVAPFAVAVLKRRQRTLKYGSLIVTLSGLARIAGILWLVLFFLRYEVIPPFDRRIWAYSLLIPVGIYTIILIRRYRHNAPARVKKDVLRERYEKYLPKPKTKRFLS